MKVKREQFLNQLELVQPGLSSRELIEQSTCFIFTGKQVVTFNDEIACRHPCETGFEGAVQAAPLLKLLQRMPEDVIEIEAVDKELSIKGKRRMAGIRMENEILLPIDQIDEPKDNEWKRLNDRFCEAVGVVRQCASKDESSFSLTCVHIHPDYIEASDRFQVTRFTIKTRFRESALVRQEPMLHIGSLDMTKFSEGESWVHFCNPTGLVVSCRKYMEDFPDMEEILKVEGEPASLPKGLEEAAETAGIFSADSSDANLVQVTLKQNKLILKGEGTNGWYREVKKLKYKGPPLQFLINPSLLKEITKRHRDCVISPTRLKVEAGKFVYVTCLEKVDDD